MRFSLKIHRKALKFLNTLNVGEKEKTIEKIKKLRDSPLRESVKIQGRKEELYRIRIGDCRVLYYIDRQLYYIDRQSSTIFVLKIDRRRRVYRK